MLLKFKGGPMDGMTAEVNEWPHWNSISFDDQLNIQVGDGLVKRNACHVYSTDETVSDDEMIYDYQGRE